MKIRFLISFIMSRYPDSNRGPTHYECVALPTEPYRQPLVSCTPAGARTLDTLIKSQVLYQLSYGCIIISKIKEVTFLLFSTPAGARTLDTLIKSQVLYQLSYGCILSFCGCKGTNFFSYHQTFWRFSY